MKDEILVAGYGGQGVVATGSLIANSAMEDGLETCGMVSYGVEMRGGTANSSVIVSDSRIGSPVVTSPTTALIFNEQSLEKYEKILASGAIIIINISECKKKTIRSDLKVVEIDASTIAEQMGNKRVVNFVMLGAYIKQRGTIKLETAKKMVKVVLPKADDAMVELNKKALLRGYEEAN